MPTERDLLSGVLQLSNLLTRRLAPVFEKAKLTPQQWAVLTALAEDETPISQVALARRLMVTKQNMTGMIARLEQLGVAEREGDPNDLRSFRIQLTRRGRALIEKLRPAYEEWLRTLSHGEITEREIQTLTKTIDRLIAQLEPAP
jgi:DNA-binding MarR family transcriptional regulator